MSIEPGLNLAQYRIVDALGAGGMGEVWRAEDTTLGREVALKVLPEEFAKDPDRMARFEREAKVLASLNHPNIATLYGLETAIPSGTDDGSRTRTHGPRLPHHLSRHGAGGGRRPFRADQARTDSG